MWEGVAWDPALQPSVHHTIWRFSRTWRKPSVFCPTRTELPLLEISAASLWLLPSSWFFYFVTISFRVCKFVFQTVQKSKEGHAVKLFSEAFQNYESYPIIRTLKFIKCLFLVEDLAVFMWLMTYVGAVPMELPFCSLPNCKFSALQCKVQVPIDDYIVLWGWDQVNYWGTQAKLSGIPKKKKQNKHLEVKNSTVTKSPLKSCNIMLVPWRNAQCLLPNFPNLILSHLLSLYFQYQVPECVRLKNNWYLQN